MSDAKKNPGNPEGTVSVELCQAYRQTVDAKLTTVDEKITGLRNTIITGLSISTAVISIVIIIMNCLG